jgi:hypothetical protein
MRLPAALTAAAAGRLFDPVGKESEADAITVRIRWFGLCIGYLYVNLIERASGRIELNSMLTLAADLCLAGHRGNSQGKSSPLELPDWRFADGGFLSVSCATSMMESAARFDSITFCHCWYARFGILLR